MENKKNYIAITHGDINGTGYEMILKSFDDPAMFELCTPIVYGSAKVADYYAHLLGIETNIFVINDVSEAQPNRLNIINCLGKEEIEVTPGTPTPESGQAAQRAIDCAINDLKAGKLDKLVTLPVNRSMMKSFNGHTHYIESKLGQAANGLSIIIGEDIRVSLVTNNLAIKDIAESITRQKIVEKGELLHQALRRDLRISSPRIAVLSLNPRCGEDGALGDEENDIIMPAVQDLEEKGIQAFGPYAADNFFGNGEYIHFDGILAMYHDQGLSPFKTLSPEWGVRFTTGLPFIRTAPACSAQFEIAGRNQAQPDSLRHAIYMALDAQRNRKDYDKPYANPLPKLYHEKRDDSEKVRFRSSDDKRQQPAQAKNA
jgi:4-hydroxythreonine-4-phosphate dehydrogenase